MSKKLSGNGRWEASRMMLPEHREALLEYKNPSHQEIKKAEIPTREELGLIRDSILLPVVLTMIDRHGKELSYSVNPLRKLYAATTQELMHRVHNELAAVNRQLRERKIKVIKDDQLDSDLHYKYICRGYEEQFIMTRDVAKASISTMIGKHIQNIIADVTQKKPSEQSR